MKTTGNVFSEIEVGRSKTVKNPFAMASPEKAWAVTDEHSDVRYFGRTNRDCIDYADGLTDR